MRRSRDDHHDIEIPLPAPESGVDALRGPITDQARAAAARERGGDDGGAVVRRQSHYGTIWPASRQSSTFLQEDSWRTVYAGELEVRPPSAFTTPSARRA
jgi:hypothetical protein